jgi:hypothetical protein
MVNWRLANRMGIQQPDHLIKTLVFKFVVACVENSAQYWTGICWIEELLAILHLLLDLCCTMDGIHLVLNYFSQLLQGKLGRWAHTPALLKFITMVGISQTTLWTQ